jgi:threonine aldolase
VAREHRLPLHMDGARIFNAALELGLPARDIARYADTVMFCVSKGLAAPVGSLLVGDESFIQRARRNRTCLGGGMRQAGVIAAAGLFALDHMIDRLADDHANARHLSRGLRELGWQIDRERPQMNMFFAEPPAYAVAEELFARLDDSGVVILHDDDSRQVRLVTHYGIESSDIEKSLERFAAATNVQAG